MPIQIHILKLKLIIFSSFDIIKIKYGDRKVLESKKKNLQWAKQKSDKHIWENNLRYKKNIIKVLMALRDHCGDFGALPKKWSSVAQNVDKQKI